MVQGVKMLGCHNISCMKLHMIFPCSPTDNYNDAQHQNPEKLNLFYFHQAPPGAIPATVFE